MDFETIQSRVTELAQGAVAKAKKLTDIAKLKMSNAAEQDAIRRAYTELGKLYFAQHGADPDPAFAALCARVAEGKEKIAYNKERIEDIKRSGDVTDADVEAVLPDEEEEPDPAPEDTPGA